MDLTKRRTVGLEHLADSRKLLCGVDAGGRNSIGARHFHDVGKPDAARRALAYQVPKEIRLGLPDGEITAVVQNENLDRQFPMRDGSQFLDVELNAAVAGQTNN